MNFKEFWRRYRGEIFKLLVTHAALAVFSIMCISPLFVLNTSENSTASSGNTTNVTAELPTNLKTIIVIVTVLVFIFYYYLVRSQLWMLGAKNKISADGGRMKLNPLAGLYMGLIASIPSFLLNTLTISMFFSRSYVGFREIYQTAVLLEFLWDAPAAGLVLITNGPFLYATMSVLPALFAGIAYYCGAKNISVFGVPKNR